MSNVINAFALPHSISSFDFYFFPACNANLFGQTISPASISWGTAAHAKYIPFWLPWDYPVARMYWLNGATLTGNADIGFYSMGGGKIWTAGSTARSGASTIQYVNAGIILPAGQYYLAFSLNATTTSTIGTTALTAVMNRATGMLQEASAMPLPTSMTGVAVSTAAYPLVGFTRIP